MKGLSSWVLAFFSSSHPLCSRTGTHCHDCTTGLVIRWNYWNPKFKCLTIQSPILSTLSIVPNEDLESLHPSLFSVLIYFLPQLLKHSSSFHSQFPFFFFFLSWNMPNSVNSTTCLFFPTLNFWEYYRGKKVCNHDSTLNPKSLMFSGLPKLPC